MEIITQPGLPRSEVVAVQQLMAQARKAHQSGHLIEAEALYLRALRRQPDLYGAQHLLGVLRSQQGRHQEALVVAEAVLKVNPDAVGALTNYGLVLHNMRRHEEALAAFDKALTIRPDHALALNNRGSVLSALGRDHAALDSFNRAIVAKPHYADACNNIGNVLKDLGLFADAHLVKYKKFTHADDPLFVAREALQREGSCPRLTKCIFISRLAKLVRS